MTDRPKYRSWKRAYGGDPDTAVLHDLHKRVTKLERAHWDLEQRTLTVQTTMDRWMKAVPVLALDSTD